MEPKESRSTAGQGGGGGVLLTKPIPSRPTLTLPPRNSADVLATPSPMTMAQSFFAEQEPDTECKSFSQLLAGAMASPTAQSAGSVSFDKGAIMNESSRGSSGTEASGSFGERSAGREAGVKGAGGGGPGALRSSTARFKSMTPSRLPIPRSTYLTIPPGFSPTNLLDSPVLLSTWQQAEPSPTTGTFPLPPFIQGIGPTTVPLSDTSKDRCSDQDGSPSFVFKPFTKLGRNPLSPLANLGPFGVSHQQALAQVQAQAHAQISSSSSTGEITSGTPPAGDLTPAVSVAKLITPLQFKMPVEPTSEPVTEPSEKIKPVQPPAPVPSPLVERSSAEDGYNWRKYGQKQVKGSEFPRSYYKCTHPNCPVKKKVERSHNGQVTEIDYKGEHNHPKPQSTRRSALAAAHISNGGSRDGFHSTGDKAEGSQASGSAQVHPADVQGERMSSVSDPSSLIKGQYSAGTGGTPEPSLGSTSDDEGEDGEGSKVEDGDGDEPDSKRRKKDKTKEAVSIAPLRTTREPRVVVQTTSVVDILDDGYRWRKYGQKVVKGNPHPRSYYKCTNLGCTVRKHVERSSTDSKAVITTYEGKHNHGVPAARNRNHETSGSAAAPLPPAGPVHIGSVGPSVSTIVKPSTSLQDQLRLGKLLGDTLKVGNGLPVGLDLGSGGMVNGLLASDQPNGGPGVDISSRSSMSLMNMGNAGVKPLEGSESFGQGQGLKPNEEEIDGQSSVQPIFSRGTAQRFALGP